MWKLGNVRIDGTVALGPMSGFTSSGYRDFMKPFGVALSYTVMTSDMGIIHNNRRTQEYTAFSDNHPTGLQIYGSVPENLAIAAETAIKVNPEIDFIDVNMGCPVPKITRAGSGSTLMKDPVLCGDIIKAIKSRVDVPVTAKIRLGWSDSTINFREIVDRLTDADADAVCIHARTRTQGYSGQPRYDLLEGFQDEMSVPLIVSGNIYLLEDAIKAKRITCARSIMVARGGVGNPFLVTQIDRYFRDGTVLPNPTVSQQVDWCLELADYLIKERGYEDAMKDFRLYAPKFISGCHRCSGYRYDLAMASKDLDGLRELLFRIRDEMGEMRINNNGRCDQESHSE